MDELLFSTGNRMALVGWALLIFVPRWRGLAQWVATFGVPTLIAVAYAALVGTWWSRGEGGFGSLADVHLLFQRPSILLAGWLHYLAFDLFVGAWIARKARVDGIPHPVVVPILVLTFLFGPIGYLASVVIRAAWKVGTMDAGWAEGRGVIARGWGDLVAREPRLIAASLGFFAIMVPTAAALMLDDRTLDGVNVWLKPLKFEVSIAIYLATLAWFSPVASDAFRESAAGRFVAWGAIGTSIFEIVYILFRASRGEAAHFNVATPTARVLYALMGLGAITLASTGLVLAWGISRRDARPVAPAYRLGIILGLVLTFALGGLEGAVMSSGTGHSVGTSPREPRPLPLVGWSRTVGDLRVPHFLGLHAQQAIAIVGAIAATYLGSRGRAAVIGFATLYALVNLGLFAQALGGRPAWPY